MPTATLAVLALVSLAAPAAQARDAAAPPLAGDERLLYAAGLMLAGSLEVFAPSEAELAVVLRAVRDGLAGRPALQVDAETRAAVQGLARQRLDARAQKARAQAKAQGEALLARAAAAPGAVTTGSGLVFRSLRDGTGPAPGPADAVQVRFTGALADGAVFDATPGDGAPASFRLDQVVTCWREGLLRMRAGGKARLVCPPGLAYGDAAVGRAIPAGAVLDLEVELVAVGAPPAAR